MSRSKTPIRQPDQNHAQENARQLDDPQVNRVVRQLLNFGLDGKGPLHPAGDLAQKARSKSTNDKQALRQLDRKALLGGSIGGFATGIGGFITMPLAIPVNVFEFYIQATRTVGAIATLRGYDLNQPQIRTAVLLTLVGSRSSKVLKTTGIHPPSGGMSGLALRQLSPETLMLVNKAIGIRLLRSIGEQALTRLGRGIPLAGGAIGAGLDLWMMKRITSHAHKEFPAQDTLR